MLKQKRRQSTFYRMNDSFGSVLLLIMRFIRLKKTLSGCTGVRPNQIACQNLLYWSNSKSSTINIPVFGKIWAIFVRLHGKWCRIFRGSPFAIKYHFFQKDNSIGKTGCLSINPKIKFKIFIAFANKDENPKLPGPDLDYTFNEQTGENNNAYYYS